jgi:hypothetical protein
LKKDNPIYNEVDIALRTLFILLDEEQRIKDLEDSEKLRLRMINLFENETEPGTSGLPYLNQVSQAICYAAKGCTFALGSTIFRSSNCRQHYVCGVHTSRPCLPCLRAEPKQGSKSEDGSVSEGKEKESSKESAQSPEMHVTTEEKDIKTEGEAYPVASEKHIKKIRAAAFEVKDANYFSVHDFDFKSKEHKRVPVCQVRTKDNELIWIKEDDWIKLKEEDVKRRVSEDNEDDDNESEESFLAKEELHRQNADVGR